MDTRFDVSRAPSTVAQWKPVLAALVCVVVCVVVVVVPAGPLDPAPLLAPLQAHAIPRAHAVLPDEMGLLRFDPTTDVYTVDDTASVLANVLGRLARVPLHRDTLSAHVAAVLARRHRTMAGVLDAVHGACGTVSVVPPLLGVDALDATSPSLAVIAEYAELDDLKAALLGVVEWLAGDEVYDASLGGFRPSPTGLPTLKSNYQALSIIRVLGAYDAVSYAHPDMLDTVASFALSQLSNVTGGFASRLPASANTIDMVSIDGVPSLPATFHALRILGAVAHTMPTSVPTLSAALHRFPDVSVQSFVVHAQAADGGFGSALIETLPEYLLSVSSLENTLMALTLLEIDIPAWTRSGESLVPLPSGLLPRARAYAAACLDSTHGVCVDHTCSAFDFHSAVLLVQLTEAAPWLTSALGGPPLLTWLIALVLFYLAGLAAFYAPQFTGLPWHAVAGAAAAVAAALAAPFVLPLTAGLTVSLTALVVGLAAGTALYRDLVTEATLSHSVALGVLHCAGVVGLFLADPLSVVQFYGLYLTHLAFLIEAIAVAAVFRLAVSPTRVDVRPSHKHAPGPNTVSAVVATVLAALATIAVEVGLVAARPDVGQLLRMGSIHGHTLNLVLLLPIVRILGGAFFTAFAVRVLDMRVQPAHPDIKSE